MNNGPSAKTDQDLISRIDAELSAYKELGLLSVDSENLIPKWQGLVSEEPARFITPQGTVNSEALANFRRTQIFIPDLPGWDKSIIRRAIRKTVTGGGRGVQKSLRECLDSLQKHGYDGLLRKYPCHLAGNPYVFNYKGYSYTYRWFKHIYFIGLFNEVLLEELDDNFVALDIGSSYGIFSSLLKQENPASHHVLVDFPEQLLLAYYFLGSCLPEARIAGVADIAGKEYSLDRVHFEAHDFTLVPISLFPDIVPGSLDVISNFASFGEMSRQAFESYIKSPQFQSAKYLFISNRVQSYPTYDTDLTILDYPIWEPEKRIHFGESPPFGDVHYYLRRRLFFNEKFYYPPYFEYAGRI